MSSVPQGNRFAPPTAHVEDVAVPEEFELAHRGARLVAVLVDAVAVGILYTIMTALFFSHQYELVRTGAMSVPRWFAYMLLLGYACFIVLNGFTLWQRSQTLGKLLLGIRIVRSDGTRASFVRIVGLRYFFTNVLGLVPLFGQIYVLVDSLLIFRESRQCLHDNIADTIVVKARSPE